MKNSCNGSGVPGSLLAPAASAVMVAMLCGSGAAVMPSPEIMDRLKSSGAWENYRSLTVDARRRGLDAPDPARLAASAAPVTGDLKALVILVDFSDNPATAGATTDSTYFRNLLFSVNSPGESLNDYYRENSYGKVTVTGDAVGWLRMPQSYAFYVNGQRGLGPYPQNAQKLAEDAVLAADAAGVDFRRYDNNLDGFLDGFFVVHAGPGFEETGNVNHIHSHKWVVQATLTPDGIRVTNYTMQPEEQGNGLPVNIGVFCHEFGHFLGLPDLYDVDGSSQGLDKWCLMAAGNYARLDGSSPAHFSAWCKIQLGWLSPIRLTVNLTNASIPQVETDTVVYRLWSGGAAGNQYFLVENRQRVRFDAFLPGAGLLIYHVDDAVGGPTPNNNEWYPGRTTFGHYRVALEQADGLFELEKSPGTGPLAADNGDPWPGNTLRTSFDDLSLPDSRAYDFSPTQVAVWNISPAGSTMTANLDVTWSRPNFRLAAQNFGDDGDQDGVPDPGENVTLRLSFTNLWQPVTDATYSVSADDPELAFSDSVVFVGAVGSGQTAANPTPFRFAVPGGKWPRVTDFYFTVRANSGAYVKTDTVRVDVGPKQLLLVDDDARINFGASLDSQFLIPVLRNMRIPFARWEVFSAGPPNNLGLYPMVFWYTGDARNPLFGGTDTILSPAEVNALRNYLDGGGSLLLSGQQIARYLDSMDTAFLHDYLHADFAGQADDFIAYGIAGDAISDSTKFILGGAGGAGNQQFKDLLVPRGGALTIFTETVVSNVTGIRYEGTYRLIFIGWGVEGIGDDVVSLGGMPKSLLIRRATDWLLARTTSVPDPGLSRPLVFELMPNYPNPFNPRTTIRFTIGPLPARVRLSIYNLLGQEVRVLAEGDYAPGTQAASWDGRDAAGRALGSGVYLYRLTGNGGDFVRKMLLLR